MTGNGECVMCPIKRGEVWQAFQEEQWLETLIAAIEVANVYITRPDDRTSLYLTPLERDV